MALSRTLAREMAFKLLFQTDVGRNPWQQAMDRMLEEEPLPDKSREFLEQLVKGTLQHLKEIDQLISQHSREWSLERMANTDRNILRMAVFEIKYIEDVPAGAAINEAVELAKRYGDENSGKFVNGILGQIVREMTSETSGQVPESTEG